MTALKGKRVGVDMAGTGGAVLAACLKRETMSLGNVEAVQLVQAEMVDALKDGAVDAAVVSEPWLTLLRESGYAVVSDAGRSGLPVVRVLVVKDAELALHAASLTALISVWDRPPPSAGQPGWEEVLRREGLSANQYRECLKMLRPVDRVENGVWLGGNSPKLEAISQQWEVILREAGIISERHLPNEPWFDDQFVKREVEK